ncbi:MULTISPECIES: glycosyltransferase [unclassified Microbacterium]|uniref:glycosyltransferase n=1 Tax=unclassified Microbacterium TaxID=2609290 RepID=UPI0015A36180|nr:MULTISPECIES: glycosyltransferase [unclassified Microbacterium]
MSRSPIGRPTIRVYEAVPGPGATVKFIDEIVRYAPEDIAFSFHSWSRAVFGRYDVAHVHWPEFYLRDPSRARRIIKRFLFRAFLARIRFTRTPVVRTVHNVKPHDAGDAGEKRLLQALDKLVRKHVVMSNCTPVTNPSTRELIPHGDFVEVFADVAREQRVEGRVLLFGRIHPYKGALELIQAASEVADAGVEVRIVGSPTKDMRSAIEEALTDYDGTAQVTTDLRSVSDEQMVEEITRAEIVALPYQDAGNGNSGVAMVALSLGRPVLVYRSCLMEELASETGAQWVQMMDGELTGGELERALRNVRGLDPSTQPRLIDRDWQSVASAYAGVFRDLTRSR